jgi:hypothetical protein
MAQEARLAGKRDAHLSRPGRAGAVRLWRRARTRRLIGPDQRDFTVRIIRQQAYVLLVSNCYPAGY